MFENLFEDFINSVSTFDIIYLIITLFTVIQCTKKGFILSLLSASKWLLAIVITIILVPRLKPLAKNYIESQYLLDIGLGIGVFICVIFIILIANRSITKIVKYSGLGGLDSFFGSIFGLFKGYIVCVVLFSLVNWFYIYEKWPFNAKKSFTFSYVYKGSIYLIKEFPNEKKYDDTKKKIESI